MAPRPWRRSGRRCSLEECQAAAQRAEVEHRQLRAQLEQAAQAREDTNTTQAVLLVRVKDRRRSKGALTVTITRGAPELHVESAKVCQRTDTAVQVDALRAYCSTPRPPSHARTAPSTALAEALCAEKATVNQRERGPTTVAALGSPLDVAHGLGRTAGEGRRWGGV
jgi:hypothetical protein